MATLAGCCYDRVLVVDGGPQGLRIDRVGVFGVEPEWDVLAADRLPSQVTDYPVLLSALPLGALVLGRDTAGQLAARVVSPVAVRGVLLPAGALLFTADPHPMFAAATLLDSATFTPAAVLDSATLTASSRVGGRDLPAGAVLLYAQGCDVALVIAPGAEPGCFSVDGHGQIVDP